MELFLILIFSKKNIEETIENTVAFLSVACIVIKQKLYKKAEITGNKSFFLFGKSSKKKQNTVFSNFVIKMVVP